MVEINNTTKQKININKTRQIVEYFLATHKKTNWEVSVAAVGPTRMRKLNKKYRGVDKATDVLSFRGGEAMNKFLGEIIINIAETKKPSKYKEVFSDETEADGLRGKALAGKRAEGRASLKSPDYLFYFLLVHGLLHLIGYDDKADSDRRKMIRLGTEFLAKIF